MIRFDSIEAIMDFVERVAEKRPVSTLANNGPTNTRVTWDGEGWQVARHWESFEGEAFDNLEVEQEAEPEERICPYCGEPGGEPRMAYSREFQGDGERGGYVISAQDCCSKCDPENARFEAADLAYDLAVGA